MAAALETFDVALSFASADEPLALQIREALQPHSVFVYSKAQEHVAGRDGTEVFRSVFRERTKLAVILFRPPWGETPYTGVEEIAIKELALEAGWEHLMFVRLTADAPVPNWVPKPHVYLDLTRYTVADLIGAIKTRLLELGVEAAPLTPADRAAAQARREAFDKETRRLLSEGSLEFASASLNLGEAIKAEAAAIAKRTGWKVEAGTGALIGGFIVTARGQGLQLASQNQYFNTARDAYLSLREYDMELTVEQPGISYYASGPMDFVTTRRLDIRRLPELGWCWELDGRVRPIPATAEAVMHILLDRIEASGGKRAPLDSIEL